MVHHGTTNFLAQILHVGDMVWSSGDICGPYIDPRRWRRKMYSLMTASLARSFHLYGQCLISWHFSLFHLLLFLVQWCYSYISSLLFRLLLNVFFYRQGKRKPGANHSHYKRLLGVARLLSQVCFVVCWHWLHFAKYPIAAESNILMEP